MQAAVIPILMYFLTFSFPKEYYRIYPKYSDTINVGTPSFLQKRHLFFVPYVSGHVPNRVFLLSINVQTHIQKEKHVPYFSQNFFSSLPEYFEYLLCLPVFPVSVIDKLFCLLKSIVG